jgi:hypothetical protein
MIEYQYKNPEGMPFYSKTTFSIIMTTLRVYLTGTQLNINTKNPEGMSFL